MSFSLKGKQWRKFIHSQVAYTSEKVFWSKYFGDFFAVEKCIKNKGQNANALVVNFLRSLASVENGTFCSLINISWESYYITVAEKHTKWNCKSFFLESDAGKNI